MMTKSNWRMASEQLMADERRRLEPPTAEELDAYTRGELPPEEEARVRERLVSHPEIARSLLTPFPTEGAEPGDPDYLSDEEFASHWSVLRKRMRRGDRGEGRVVQFWRGFSAAAAMLALLLGLGWWRSLSRAIEPRLVEQTESLLPDGRRGPQTAPDLVRVHGDSVVLVIPLIGATDYAEYRLALIRAETNRTIWRSANVRPREGVFAIMVPKRFVEKGEYRIAVHGIAGGGEQQIAAYSVRIE